MRTIEQIRSDFEKILTEVIKIDGVSEESAVQVSAVILQEYGKYNRFPDSRAENGNEIAPATFEQKKAMKNLKLSFPENISKAEASRVIEVAVERFRGNGKGGSNPAFSSFQK
jgi:hypothetical protein